MRRLGPLLVLTALAGLTAFAPAPARAATTDGASPTATFGLGPATATKVDGRPYFNYVLSPGSRFTDHVAIVNVSAQPLSLDVYVTDAANGLDGSFTYPGKGSVPVQAGRWMRVGTSSVVVPGRATRILPVEVAVPDDAAPGDHAAAVIVSLTAQSNDTKGQRVDLEQRVAARTFFRVSGPLRPALSVERLQVTWSAAGMLSGTATVRYRVHNTGNVKLAADQRVRVSGLLSSRTWRGTQVPVLLPGGQLDVSAAVKDVTPQVWMQAAVTLIPLGIQGDAVPALGDTVVSTHFLAIPWVLVAVLALLLLVALGGVWRRRRRVRETDAPAPSTTSAGSVPVPDDEPVRSWTRLAAGSAVLLAIWGSATPIATADSVVPYDDPAVTGTVGFCDVSGKNVLSGKVTDRPFVWRAVGSSAAPTGYADAGRTAFLVAQQPRQGYDPGNWSGFTLSAASRYSNAAHPMAQFTPISSSLSDFLSRYPAQWNGIVQLRLVLGGTNRTPRTDAYDATDIQVTGDDWRVIRGGAGPCNAGKAESQSVLRHLPGASGTPRPGAVSSPPALAQTPLPQVTKQARGIPAATVGSGSPKAPDATAASSSGIKGGSLVGVVAAAAAAGLLLGGLVLWAVRRRDSLT